MEGVTFFRTASGRRSLTANKSVDLEADFDKEANGIGIKLRSEALRYRYLLDYIRQWVEGNDSPHIYNLD